MKKALHILDMIAQGEHEHQDFKYQITDACKIARSISAFANHSGGRLLVGVKDNGTIVGVSSDEEAYMVEQAAQMYCRPEQVVTFRLHRSGGKTILEAQIAEAPVADKPVLAPDEQGRWRAYYRVADENVLANDLHVRLMRQQSAEALADGTTPDSAVPFGTSEHLLLDYLRHHGGISIQGYERLAHISLPAAEQSVLNLCRLGLTQLAYHNGQCLITAGYNFEDNNNP